MKKSIYILTWLSLLLAWCGTNSKNISIDSYEKTYQVLSWSIDSNNKYVWTLQSEKTSFLSFKMPGRIVNLFVKEWDKVKAWQILAILGWNEVKTQFSSAKDMLASLWAMYKSTENMFDAQIKSVEAKVAQAKAGMEWLKTGVQDTENITKEQLLTAEKQVKQAEIWLQTAETNLNHTKQVLKQKEKDVYSNAKNAVSNTKILLTNFLLFVDQTFGISDENKHKNDSFDSYLSAKNTSLKEEIKTLWRKINGDFISWKQETDQLLTDIQNSSAVEDDDKLKQRIYENLQKAKDLLISSRSLASKVFTAIDSSVASSFFPQTMINQYKQQATTFQNNIEKTLLTAQWNFLLWVKWSIQAIDNLKKQTSMQLDLLEKQYQLAKAWYETAKQTYEQYKAMSEWKVNEVSTKFEVAKKQYEEALKGLEALKKQKQAQLSQIKSQINQVKWNKNLAAVSLWNIKLFAPYDGVITQKMANIWQVVGAGMPIFQIADETKLKAVFYVPVKEVSSIKEWQKVILEALWTTLTWTISLIYPSADMYSKKIPVEVKLSWTAPKNWKLGMYISWYPISKKIHWIIIPQDFIHYEYGKAYVYKKEDNDYKKTYIKIWKCDNDYCIVEDWLKVNETVK